MIFIVYVRVSTEQQEKRGYSIPEQVEAGKNKAFSLGAKEDEIFIFIDNETGEFLNRTEFQKALDIIAKSDVDYFICLDPDRFSRKTVNALIAQEMIEKNDTEIVYCNSEYEKTPEGKLFLQIKMVIAEYEKEKIKIRTMMGKLGKAKRKLLTHNPNLYGYNYDSINDILIINEEEAKVIKLIIRWIFENDKIGINKIAERLNSMNIFPPRGKKVNKKENNGNSYIKEEGIWHRATIRRILRNYTYTGTLFIQTVDTQGVKFNKYRKDEDKIKRIMKPREEWIGIQVPEIVPVDIWEKLQDCLQRRRDLKPGIAKEDYLLSGLLRCSLCKHTLHGNRVKKKNSDEYYKYYVCTAKSPGILNQPKCKLPNINSTNLENMVWEKVKSWVMNPELLRELIANKNNLQFLLEEKDNLNKEIELLNKEKSKLDILYMKSKIEENEYDTYNNDIQKNKNILLFRLNDINKELKSIEITEDIMDKIKKIFNEYNKDIENISYEYKKYLIHLIVYYVDVVNENKGYIIGRFPESWTEETTLWRVVTTVQN
jgi:site-specific DNA recombinase